MCGKETSLVSADVEGVELKVCSGCSQYGTIKKTKKNNYSSHRRKVTREQSNYRVVKMYSSLLRKEREKRNMNHKEFATFINERESLVSKWEQGSLHPNLTTARKLSKLLKIKLVELEGAVSKDGDDSDASPKAKKAGELTIGDFIKVRKKK